MHDKDRTAYDDTPVQSLPRLFYGVADANGPAQTDARGVLPTLHQTVANRRLTREEHHWRESWRRLGFPIRTADNAQARRDIERMHRMINFPALIHMFDALETNTQRSDVWRYAILWLEGGIYADIDVVALSPLVDLVRANIANRGVLFSESLAVFDYLPRPLSKALCTVFRTVGLTDLVRLPQRRNCIILAHARCPLMLRSLQMIVDKFSDVDHVPIREPARTLELTGPGIFTDAIDALSTDIGELAGGFQLIHRSHGRLHFHHIGMGTWKTYRGDNRDGLQSHERNLLYLIMAVCATLALVCVICNRRRIRPVHQRDWHHS